MKVINPAVAERRASIANLLNAIDQVAGAAATAPVPAFTLASNPDTAPFIASYATDEAHDLEVMAQAMGTKISVLGNEIAGLPLLVDPA